MPGIGLLTGRYLLGRTGDQDFTAAAAAFWA